MKKGSISKAIVLDAALFALLFMFGIYSGIWFDPVVSAVGFIIVFFLLFALLNQG